MLLISSLKNSLHCLKPLSPMVTSARTCLSVLSVQLSKILMVISLLPRTIEELQYLLWYWKSLTTAFFFSLDTLQFVFQKGCSTVQCTWAVQETISSYLRKGSEVYCCLLDFSKGKLSASAQKTCWKEAPRYNSSIDFGNLSEPIMLHQME